MKMLSLTLLICMPISGCATYYWSKPGVTQQQVNYDQAECTAEAGSRAPPALQAYPIGSGYTRPIYTSCMGIGAMVDCTTTGGGYTPPTYMTIDLNASTRDAAYEACLYRRGYRKVQEGSNSNYGQSKYGQCMDSCAAEGQEHVVCWRRCQ